MLIDLSDGKFYKSDITAERIAEIQTLPTTPPDSAEVADYLSNVKIAVTRLNSVINDPTTTDTAAEVRQVVIDLAKIQLRMIAYLQNKI